MLEPRQLKAQHYCQLSSLSMEIGRTAKDFGGQYSHDIRGHRFRMQFIQCNKLLVGCCSRVCFLLGGKTMRTMVQFSISDRKVQHYINTVIEYGHFRLKIGGISRLTISQRESSPRSELYKNKKSTADVQ